MGESRRGAGVIVGQGWWPCCLGMPPKDPLPPGERRSRTRASEAHLGVRFDDWARGEWTITLDGEDVTDRCVELVASEDGWVELQRENSQGRPLTHTRPGVPGSLHIATELRRGVVQASLRPNGRHGG